MTPKKSVKISNGYAATIFRRTTVNIMTKRNGGKRHNTTQKI